MEQQRPFSQACKNNKKAILAVISDCFATVDEVLEVGSGTGQHAVFFARQLPHLIWQCSDQLDYLPGINSWLDWAGLDNVNRPILLDVNKPWPLEKVPAIFTANSLHIMSWQEVIHFFNGIARHLSPAGILCVYGPFN